MESMTKMLRAAVILGLLAGLPALALSESPQSLLKRLGWLRRQTAQMLASLQAAVDATDVEPQPTPLPPETPPEQSAPLSAPLPAEDLAVGETPEPGLPVLPPTMSAHYPGRLTEAEGEPVAASVEDDASGRRLRHPVYRPLAAADDYSDVRRSPAATTDPAIATARPSGEPLLVR